MPTFTDTYVNTHTSQSYPFDCTYDVVADVVHWKAMVDMPNGERETVEGKTEGDGQSPSELIAGNAVRQAVALESFTSR